MLLNLVKVTAPYIATDLMINMFSDLFLNFTLLEQIWCVTVCQKQADGQSAELAVRDNGSTGK